ncbi:MAG: membrane protein insertase YidC [Hyphomicrobiales bacterium]|nr:MAG: membrane protein insertase YidC [Hyphomicrobiales bacterium]
MGDNKNFLLAIALSMIVLVGWQFLVGIPNVKDQKARQQKTAQQSQNVTPGAGQNAPATGPQAPTMGPQTPQAKTGAPSPSAPAKAAEGTMSREQALKASPRVTIKTPTLNGSIALTGARIDDLHLIGYHETVKKSSPAITLLSPSGGPKAYYIEHGWTAQPGADIKLPAADTVWSTEGGAALTPSTPVTVSWNNGQGLTFRRTFSIDDGYMFKVRQEVENAGDKDVVLFPYALISRHGKPETKSFYILHEGLIGYLGESGLEEISYDDIKDDVSKSIQATGGWVGITDKYWASAIIPDQASPYKARFSENATVPADIFQADYLLGAVTIPAGGKADVSSHAFAGAKKVSFVDGYQEKLKIQNFELLIDWGWFHFITKPLFFALEYFYKLLGNFGVAILVVTVIIKLIFFPLANKSYVSMSKMKKLQPEINKLKERYKDDKVKQQQAQMELFKKEKVNPMSGCLPMVIQIPVFFALYKVLFVTIEMRHAPFFGWIQDLAAPDPTNLFNLFGLIPWDPPQMLTLGIWPLIMGITMFVQMKLNPAPADAMQQKIFTWMPIVFTFMLASFPAGLVIYWAWNNVLSTLQQGTIMKRQGVKIELWDNLVGMFNSKKTAKGKD